MLICVTISLFFIGGCVQNKTGYYFERMTDITLFNSYITEDIKFYPLESSTDESLIGRVDKIIRKDSLFYILDNKFSKGIFLFDINGKLCNKFVRVGNGPYEYHEIQDFDLCRQTDEIAILCDRHGKLIFMDGDMKPVCEVAVHKDYLRMIAIDDWIYLYEYENSIDRMNVHTKQIEPVYKGRVLKGYAFSPEPVFYRSRDNIFFYSPGSDTIFKYTNGTFLPAVALDFEMRKEAKDYFSKDELWNAPIWEIAKYPLPSIFTTWENAYGTLDFLYSFSGFFRIHYVKEDEQHVDAILHEFGIDIYCVDASIPGKLLTTIPVEDRQKCVEHMAAFLTEEQRQFLLYSDNDNPTIVELTLNLR